MIVKLMNLQKDREIIFDRKTYVLNEKDLGKADISLNTFQGNNQIGVKVTGRSIESRDISIVGYILADNEQDMINKKRNLQRMVNPLEDFFLIIGEYQIQVSATSSIEYGVSYSENNKWIAKFLINGTCGNPCFTKINTTVVPIAYWQAGLHFPLNLHKKIVMGIRQPSKIKMIENVGEVDTGIIIKFRVTGNEVKNPFLINLITQEKIQLKCTLNQNDIIEINTNYGEKTVLKNGEDYFSCLDIDSDFIQLHSGENYLIYGAEQNDGKLEIDIEFNPQFLEV